MHYITHAICVSLTCSCGVHNTRLYAHHKETRHAFGCQTLQRNVWRATKNKIDSGFLNCLVTPLRQPQASVLVRMGPRTDSDQGVLARLSGRRPGFPSRSPQTGCHCRRRIASWISFVLPLALNHGGPYSPEDSSSGNSASSNSDVALYLAIPDGRPSSTCFATAAAVTSALRGRILSWRCALRFQEAELSQQTLQLQ